MRKNNKMRDIEIYFIAITFSILSFTIKAANCLAIDLEDTREYLVETHEDLFKDGCALINPYIILKGKKPKDSSTKEAKKEIKEGIEMLDCATKINPKNWNAFWYKGKAYQAMEDDYNAYKEFKKSYKIQRNNADVAREYMMECLFLGRGKEGVKAAKHALELRPDDTGLMGNLGLALLIDGQVDEAIKMLSKAYFKNMNDVINKRAFMLAVDVKQGTRKRPRNLFELYR